MRGLALASVEISPRDFPFGLARVHDGTRLLAPVAFHLQDGLLGSPREIRRIPRLDSDQGTLPDRFIYV